MLMKKMFSVFIALSMAVVLSGCGVSSSMKIQEPITSHYYEKVSVVSDSEASAQKQAYQKKVQKRLQRILTDELFTPFDKPTFGQDYGNGEVLIVKIRVLSADEGYASGVAMIEIEVDFSDSNGRSLGSVVVEGVSELGEFEYAFLFAVVEIKTYITRQFGG